MALDRTFAADRTWALLASLPVTRTFLAPTMILAMRDVAGHARVPLESLHTIYTRTSFLNRCAGGHWRGSGTASSTCTA